MNPKNGINLLAIAIGNGVFVSSEDVLGNATTFQYNSHYQFGPELSQIY